MAGALDRFSGPTRAWFTGAFAAPTPAQDEGWDAIAEGKHVLLSAPTGSGKTLAAFLWALDRLATEPTPTDEKQRCRVLYVSPLKALAYDVERNLQAPLTGMAIEAQRAGLPLPDIRIGARTGDTPADERRALVRHPPDILVTTPESLYLLLTSQARAALAGVETVIVDEIHAVASTKRGSHLALTLERLEQLVVEMRGEGATFQRIGLSATQRPLSEVGKFLGGLTDGKFRPVTIVDAHMPKEFDIQIVVPVEDMAQLGKPMLDKIDGAVINPEIATSPEARHSIWPALQAELLHLIRAHKSTLVFVNNRRLAERIAASINELADEQLARAHHGSIAREQRLEIEDALKAGNLPALVCTSTLELGIDMGSVDLVVCVESPPSVASGLQRIGRAGHQVGVASRGRIFPKFRGDLVVSAVTVAAMKQGAIETTRVPRIPLDVLAQQIVAKAVGVMPAAVPVAEFKAMARNSYPYAEISDDAFDGVLDMLSGRYPSDEFAELKPRLTWDRATDTITARPAARMLAVISGGTIPDRGLYGVFTPDNSRVGELDEEMVFESRVGEIFLLGATSWRIEDITRDKVIVTPAPGTPGKMPFWKADIAGRPVELGKKLGKFIADLDTTSNDTLREECGLDERGIVNLRAYIADQREASQGLVPTDKQIVVERFRDELGDWRLCILSPFGSRVHAPWAMAIEARLRDQFEIEAQLMWTDDGIALRVPEADEPPPLEWINIDPDQIEDLVVAELGRSGVFAARFRENAARALLLPRRRPGQRTPLWQMRQRSADLLAVASNYGSFPILLETYRECLRDAFDVPALQEILRDIQQRKIRVTPVDTPLPSPFASGLANAYVASFLYDGDAPMAERRAQALTLDRRLLAELVGSEELRELLDADALAALEDDLQGLSEKRKVGTVDQTHDLLRRVGDLSLAELQQRSVHPGDTEDLAQELLDSRRALKVRVAGEDRLIAVEDAGRYRDALGTALPVGVPEAFLAYTPDALLQLVRRWARTHGPFVREEPSLRFGVPVELVDTVLDELEGSERIVRGEFRPGGAGLEFCDAEVLRQLRQRSLAALRKQVAAVDTDTYARFLPHWQGLGSTTSGLDRAYEAIAQLQGVAIPASVLERDVLSTRVQDYSPRLLDDLLASGEILWVGAGPLGGSDGKVMLFRRDQAPLLRAFLPTQSSASAGGRVDKPSDKEHVRIREMLQRRGACFFTDLRGDDDKTSLDALWDLVWAGEVTNDTFAPVRALSAARRAGTGGRAGNRPRPGRLAALGPPTAAGRWSLTHNDDEGESGPSKERVATAMASALLERYGVVTRGAVRAEGVTGGFAAVYAALKAMEEGGRIRRGYFVEGLGGAQFALPGAVERLRSETNEDTNEFRAVALAATDPANPFGIALPWPVRGPQRAAGAFVIAVDGRPVLYLEKGGRTLVDLTAEDAADTADAESTDERLAAAAHALSDLVENGRFRRLALTKYPDALERHLLDAGFTASPKGLTRYGPT
jgi:ATP-dependent helicase Lhr and Lhr-like helicase